MAAEYAQHAKADPAPTPTKRCADSTRREQAARRQLVSSFAIRRRPTLLGRNRQEGARRPGVKTRGPRRTASKKPHSAGTDAKTDRRDASQRAAIARPASLP